MKTQAEIGVICLEAKECQDSHQKLVERHGRDSLSEPPEGTKPANTFILPPPLDFLHSRVVRQFLWLEPLTLCYFVTAAPGNKYRVCLVSQTLAFRVDVVGPL